MLDMATKKLRKSVRQITASPGDVNKSPCAFCQRNVDDEVIFGKLYAIGDIQCHYFCVLLSCCIIQKGKDDEGLFGFVYSDILAEIERSKKHKCSYCGKVGATLGCSITQCRKQFHLPCGRNKNAVSLFHGNYKSFCQQHAPKQKIPDHIMSQAKIRMRLAKTSQKLQQPRSFSDLKELTPVKRNTVNGSEFGSETSETESVCVICYETVDGFPTSQTFWPSCCARDAWFHRSCLQRMALTAGMHYLKCPLCNDKDNFYDAVMAQGFYIPDRDAAWELEQDAFVDIYEREVSCDAKPCQCQNGRGYDDSNSVVWEIIMCIVCGDGPCHLQCSGVNARDSYICMSCIALVGDAKELKENIKTAIAKEEAQKKEIRRLAPIMPSRMSLRRTKLGNNINMASSSRQNTQTSRLELNLKTPRKQQTDTNIKTTIHQQQDLFSPTKVIKDSLNSKMLADVDSKLIETVRETFKKPRPLCVKKKIVDEILDNYLKKLHKQSPKTKEKPKVWISPKKCCDINSVQNKKTPLKIYFKTKDISPISNKQITPINTEDCLPISEDDNNTKKIMYSPEKSNENCIEDTQYASNDKNSHITPNKISKDTIEVSIENNNKHITPKKSDEDCTEDTKYVNNDDINQPTAPKTTKECIEISGYDNNQHNTPIKTNTDCIEVKNVSNDVKDKHTTPKKTKDCIEICNDENKIHSTPKNTKIDGIEAENIGNDKKNKDASPKKAKDIIEISNDDSKIHSTPKKSNADNIKETDIPTNKTVLENDAYNDESSNSTFQLPSEFIADTLSDDSVPFLETPRLKTVDIEKDSLEISNNDQTVNIDMFPVENGDSECVNNDKLLLKFYDSKESLNKNVDIDIESFKNQYLTEVDRNVKCSYNHKHIKEETPKSPVKLRTAIDFALEAFEKENGQKNNEKRKKLKRKLNTENPVPKKKVKKVCKKEDSIQIVCSKETEASIDLRLDSKIKLKKMKRRIKNSKKLSARNIQVKIKWKREELKLQITDGKRKKKKLKTKKDPPINPLNLKQYILKYSPEASSSTNVISKPEGNLTPIKRKYVKQEKTPDNFKQTSIQNFFKKLN